MLEGVSISLKISLPVVSHNLENSGSHYSNNIWPFNLQCMWSQCTCVNSIPYMNKIARFHQSLTNINFEMLFAYITSENQQRQHLLQQLLGIFPRPTNFFNGKTNCCSYPMSFCDKDVNRDGNFKLIFPSFSMACPKPVGFSEFLILEKLQEILALP